MAQEDPERHHAHVPLGLGYRHDPSYRTYVFTHLLADSELVSVQIIAGAIGLGWWVSHNSTEHATLKAIGGSAGEKATSSSAAVAESASANGALASSTSTSFHVSPTNTVARRAAEPIPTPEALYPGMARSDSSHRVHVVQTHQRHGRRNKPLNRTTH